MSGEERLEVEGSWWIPGSPDKRRGRLVFERRTGASLQLEQPLPGFPALFPEGDAPTLLGEGFNFQRYTLVGAWDQARNIGGPYVQAMHADTVIEGVHLAEPEPAFDRLIVRFDELARFVGYSGLSVTSSSPGAPVAVEWEPTPQPAVRVGEVDIEFTAIGSFGWHSEFDHSLAHLASIELRSPRPLTLEDWSLRFVSPLVALAAFGLGVWPQEVRVYAGPDPLRVRVHSSARAVSGPRHRYAPVLFTLDELPDDAVSQWLAFRDGAREAYDLFAEGELLAPSLLPHSQVLEAARFIEVFHRGRWDGGQAPRAQHRERVKSIVASAPEGHREWLRSALAFSNELRLRDRILKLLEVVGPAVGPALGDADQFAAAATNTRNYHTHYGSGIRARSASGEGLVRLADRLSLVVRACALTELGIDAQQVAALLARDRRYAWLAAGSTEG